MEVLTRIIQFKLSLPQINQHGLDIVGRQYHILGCLNQRAHARLQ